MKPSRTKGSRRAPQDLPTSTVSPRSTLPGIDSKDYAITVTTLVSKKDKRLVNPDNYRFSTARTNAAEPVVSDDCDTNLSAVCPHPLKQTFVVSHLAWMWIDEHHVGDEDIHPYRCVCGALHIGHHSGPGVVYTRSGESVTMRQFQSLQRSSKARV